MKKYYIGFDPGIRNLGIGIFNATTNKSYMYIVDLAKWSGIEHELMTSDYGPLIFSLMYKFKKYIFRAFAVGIEHQPAMGIRNALSVQCHLESVIRGINPSIPVILVNPRSVRLFWKTSGATYAERKSNSTKTLMFEPKDEMLMKIKFRKAKVSKVDAIEALQLAVYLSRKIEEIPKILTGKRNFQSLKYSCTIRPPK